MSLPNAVVRIVTAVVAIPLVVGSVYLGGWPYLVVVMGAALVAQHELYAILRKMDVRAWSAAGLTIGAVVGLRFEYPPAVSLAVALTVVLVLIVLVSGRFETPWKTLSATLAGVFYPTILLAYLIDLRAGAAAAMSETEAVWITLFVLALVWVSDTAAYYVGRGLGRRPLARGISPNKTWEGSIGGAAGALVAALLLWKLGLVSIRWYDHLALGLICGTVGQVGDLAESRLKRLAGVKDSGAILPGHGGILDRLDAMIIAVPLAYLYLAEIARVL